VRSELDRIIIKVRKLIIIEKPLTLPVVEIIYLTLI